MKSKVMEETESVLVVTFSDKEVELLEEFFGQFTFDTILKVFRDGDYSDALDGKDSETGFAEGGFDTPYKKVIDDLYSRLYKFCNEKEDHTDV